LILVVPVAAVVALATARLVDVGQDAYHATLIRSLASLSTDVAAITQDLHRERMAAAAYLTTPSLSADSYDLHVRRTDERIKTYNAERGGIGEVPTGVQERLNVIAGHLTTLNSIRQRVLDRGQMSVAEVVLRYGVVLTDLVSFGETLGQIAGEGATAQSLRAVSAFAKAKAARAEEEAILFASLSTGQLDGEQFSAFLATLTGQQEALLAFSLVASAQQESLVSSTVAGDAVVLADRVVSDVIRGVGKTHGISADTAGQAAGAVNDLMRFAELRLEEELLARAEQARADVVQQAIVEAALLLITLVVAIAIAVVLARSLNHSLRRLRMGALSVANHDLPDAVSRLRDVGNVGEGGVEEIVRQVRDPIRLTNRDEVGEVAAAFNVVHRKAVRIAAEQAALRTSVSAMFLNLARRSQTLVDRMIGELDAIERGEEDPKRLARLFELDHLATRMRRNDENLLVLAGADSTPPRSADALLVDVLRAAQSEVEVYSRIEFGAIDTEISVAAHAVNDVVRLVAELLDNATRFSPPDTAVIAGARRFRDYVLVQVEDRGLGLSDDQLDTLNRRLAAPPTVDVAAFRLMGLAVVSRLASRYGIRVELRRNVAGGLIAQVTLPSNTVVLPEPPRDRDQVLSRPRGPLAVAQAPAALTSWKGRSGPGPLAGTAPRSLAAAMAGQETLEFQTLSRSSPAPVSYPQSPTGFPAHTVAPTPSCDPAPLSAPTHLSAPAPLSAPARAEDTREFPIFRETEADWFRSHGPDSTATVTRPTAAYQPPAVPAPAPAPAQRAAQPVAAAAPERGPTVGRDRLPGPTPQYVAVPAGELAHEYVVPAPYTPPPVLPAPAPEPTGWAPEPTGWAPEPAGRAPEPAGRAPDRSAAGSVGSAWRTSADEGWARANRAAAPTAGGTTRSGLPKRVPQAQLVPGGVQSRTAREKTRRTPDDVRGLLSAYHRGVQRGRSASGEQSGTTSTKEISG
jgi:signal transduction histidine kinase